MTKTESKDIIGLMSRITILGGDTKVCLRGSRAEIVQTIEENEAEPDWDGIFEEVKKMKCFPVDKTVLEDRQPMFRHLRVLSS
ncbi:MAG: hypothetical protein J7J76_02145 [Candidatus Latescibacteria bacterium]|nr:hypothetical protein [Candidatus Latescibacterota bacterium]